SRTDYELELSSRRVAARTRVGWTYSKMPARPLQLRRVAISSLLRSGISKPAESENYVLKSHTCPSANCHVARHRSQFFNEVGGNSSSDHVHKTSEGMG